MVKVLLSAGFSLLSMGAASAFQWNMTLCFSIPEENPAWFDQDAPKDASWRHQSHECHDTCSLAPQGAPQQLFELKKLLQTHAAPPQDAPH